MIHVVTPVTRPRNLPAIYTAILACGHPFHWHVVFDFGEQADEGTVPYPYTDYVWHPSNGRGAWGNLQRNRGLDDITAGYVYFCDDDNIPHRDLFDRAMAMQENTDRIVIVNQVHKDGSLRLRANGEINLGDIDTAQAFIPRALIGDLRWEAMPNPADYGFLRALWKKYPEKFLFLDENLSYYNHLR